ncbi:hypothetical protein VPH35_061378 [Triticum aestivum]
MASAPFGRTTLPPACSARIRWISACPAALPPRHVPGAAVPCIAPSPAAVAPASRQVPASRPVAVDAKSKDHRAWDSPSTTTNAFGFAKYTTGKTTRMLERVPNETPSPSSGSVYDLCNDVPSTSTGALNVYEPCTTTTRTGTRLPRRTQIRQVPLQDVYHYFHYRHRVPLLPLPSRERLLLL